MAEKEAWKNPGGGPVYIPVTGPGGLTRDERVSPGMVINIETSDRQAAQNLVLDKSKDFFTNGRLLPVKLIESAEDYEEISSNPNLIGESELGDLLEQNTNTFKKSLDDIQNASVLKRLKELAETSDEVSAAKVRALDSRIEEVSPKLATEGKTVRGADDAKTDFAEVKL